MGSKINLSLINILIFAEMNLAQCRRSSILSFENELISWTLFSIVYHWLTFASFEICEGNFNAWVLRIETGMVINSFFLDYSPLRQNIRINFERKRDLVANCSFLRFNGAMKKRSNKIRDLFKVKLYAIRSETKKKRERERER